ncbi:hypothetical protein PRVXH_000822 [Proteinivorax hydrogeniformans]|uniref:Uncharacterized protein n=1 Tax=Proteinivorax hydrogeniformans TaxID=1826727 RepID=A0AAU8HVT2_9FIRM
MTKRTFKSPKYLFWDKKEWQEAAETLANSSPEFVDLTGKEQVSQMIGWLSDQYPVEQEEIDKAKAKV